MMKLRSLILGLSLVLGAGAASAADAGATAASSTAAPKPPPGHPAVADDGDEDPHAHGQGMPQVKQDGAEEDDKLPAGTIVATILDPSDRPIPKAGVTLGILQNSVAKGENRKRVFKEADEHGVARWDNLETGVGYAYRITVTRDMATFAVPPVQLSLQHGVRAELHVYPVVTKLDDARIGAQSVVFIEMKDDRVQVHQVLSLFNLGQTAWVPQGVTMKLPEGFTALNNVQQMSDVGIDPVEKVGARLRGTFGPGRHVVEYSWQYPYSGTSTVDLDFELPPRVVAARVIAPASQQMKLSADGFPPAETMFDPQGQRVLQTERVISTSESPLRRLHVTISNLPTEGPAKVIVTALAGIMVLGVVGWAVRLQGERQKGPSKKEARSRLLEELEELERARASGEVGPKTYERARRDIIDAIARTLAEKPV